MSRTPPPALVVLLVLATPSPGVAQHEHHAAAPFPRTGSGTAWLPASVPMRAFHANPAGWSLMLHGDIVVQFVRTFGTRGDYQLGSANWIMGEAVHPLAGGTFGVRMMASAEVLTVTERGYPQLLQVAQPYRGATLTDRMHPHEMVSEAALTYERPIIGDVQAFLYLAAVGEPPLGPVAYRHRPSALNDPATPLGHHAQDVTHESFGVATVGVFTRGVRIEASVFNGAHPDEVRTNFDYAGARMNSYAARLTVNPTAYWSVAASGGYLAATGGAHAHGVLRRFGFSVLHSAPRPNGQWSTAFVWGANVPADSRRVLQSVLIETSFEPDGRNAIFGRVEHVTRTPEELDLVGSVSAEVRVNALSAGYARRVGMLRGVAGWLGVRGVVHVVPEELRLFYGSRTPVGLIAYLQLRPPLIAAR